MIVEHSIQIIDIVVSISDLIFNEYTYYLGQLFSFLLELVRCRMWDRKVHAHPTIMLVNSANFELFVTQLQELPVDLSVGCERLHQLSGSIGKRITQ